jgi:hypothetical protein
MTQMTQMTQSETFDTNDTNGTTDTNDTSGRQRPKGLNVKFTCLLLRSETLCVYVLNGRQKIYCRST